MFIARQSDRRFIIEAAANSFLEPLQSGAERQSSILHPIAPDVDSNGFAQAEPEARAVMFEDSRTDLKVGGIDHNSTIECHVSQPLLRKA